jgi:hypothetical protein
MSSVASGIFARFLELGFPSRGAIARGQVWWTAAMPISLGPAVVAAYEAADALDVFGIVLDDSALGIAAAAETREFDAPMRNVATIVRRRFARLAAFDNFGLVCESYVRRFERLAAEYAQSAGAKPHVSDRYARSVEVVRAMLLP